MKITCFRKTLVYVMTLTLIAAVFSSLSLNVAAEEPPEEPPYEEDGWFVKGNGTYFEITNSSYLNVSLTSSENVQIYMFSMPNIVYYHIESNCSANSTSVTLTGFEINETYYHYQDCDLVGNFTTDETGSYSYTQDLETYHDVYIQNYTSTIIIQADGSINPPSAPISRSGETYTLTGDINEQIIIERSGITLDGNGYTLQSFDNFGIYLNYVSGVTVKNLNIYDVGVGIYCTRGSNSNLIKDNTISNVNLGIWIHWADGNTIESNTISNTGNGIYIYEYSHFNVIRYNTITDSSSCGINVCWSNYNDIRYNTITDSKYHGISLSMWCRYNTIDSNQISWYGFYGLRFYYRCDRNIITENVVQNGGRYGIFIDRCLWNQIVRNTFSNNDYYSLLLYYSDSIIHHNNIYDGHYGYYSFIIWDDGAGEGNYWDDYTGTDTNGDGVGDTDIPHRGVDYYPLMNPWSANDPPVANAGGPYDEDEGTPITFDASGSSDPDEDELQYRWDFDNDATWDTTYITDPTATHTWGDDYSGTVVVEVYDGEYTDTDTATVTVNNVVPIANAGIDHVGDEPSTFIFTGAHTDPGTMDTHTYDWDFDYDGITFDIDATGNDVSNTWEDDFDGAVALRVTDDDGGWHIDTCHVIVNNVAPTIEFLDLPIDPLEIVTAADLTATFTDPGILDTHTATIDWGDGNTTSGIITGSSGTYTVIDSWIYGQAGVYTVTLIIEDDDGGISTETFKYVVVYDPTGGFVTGGGWINSPEGAYSPDLTLTGKANFGFVSRYKKGQSTPSGNTEFNFKVASMNFHSDNYEWMVIAGAKAMYKGTGTINGVGSYGFMLSAIDEELTQSTDLDLFRIKIWDKDDNNNIIYDNNLGNEDDEDPTTAIGGGQIVIHKK